MNLLILMKTTSYLLFVYLIEDIYKTGNTNYPELVVQDNAERIEKDFNYNDLSLEQLSAKKLPYFNCNRKAFFNSYFDLLEFIESRNEQFRKSLIEKEFARILFFARDAIEMIVPENKNFFLFYKFDKPSNAEKNLKEEARDISVIMKNQPIIMKYKILDFLLAVEGYIYVASNTDLFKIFFGPKLSTLFNKDFTEYSLNVNELKCYIQNVFSIFCRAQRNFNRLKEEHFIIEKNKNYITCSFYLKECILLKWMVEIERVHVFYSTNNLENFNHMLIYSINSNDILMGELSNIVRTVVDTMSDMKLELLRFVKVQTSSCANNSRFFNSYEFELNNKKRYIIKRFDLEKYEGLPSGFSTAYLDCKRGFESFGFMGVKKVSLAQLKYYFLSVEEKPSFYLATKYDLSVFRRNSIQAFYFLLYVLELMNSLYIFRMEFMLNNEWSSLVFAVDTGVNE